MHCLDFTLCVLSYNTLTLLTCVVQHLIQLLLMYARSDQSQILSNGDQNYSIQSCLTL